MNINTKIFDEMSDNDFFSNKFTHIYFNKRVTNKSVSELIDSIHLANKPTYSENGASLNPKPILIHISSHGGSVSAGMRLLSVYALSKVPIVTIVDNYSCSAATYLSISSHYRLITKYGYCLIHEYSIRGQINSRQHQITNYVNLVDTYFDKIMDMYLEQTKFKKEELKELMQHDLLLDSDFCLKKGIVDRVIDIKRKKPKEILNHDIYNIIQNYNYNNITISCKDAVLKLDNILFEKNLSPVIIYPKQYGCHEDNDKDETEESVLNHNIFDIFNLIPRIQNIDAPTYAIIEGPITIDELLPLLYCDHIILFDYAYIVSNIIYINSKIGYLLTDNVKNTDLIFNVIKKILKEKTKMTNIQIENIKNKFTIIDAIEAKKLGLCTDIIKYHRQNQKVNSRLIQSQSLKSSKSLRNSSR
jgi:ATP-dependent protease ClpP protease subunit